MFNNFTDFLCEAIKFAKGKDNDYFFHNYAIITFNKGDVSKYKVEGKTAGLWSHACMQAFKPDRLAIRTKRH